ncbi:MAG: NYN domain-containing protein [Lachnospiraceae bacterium]|nr:NYN domain-containing protein [Lachnospiraceae bacterium]
MDREKQVTNINIGLVASVDMGKTTLAEGILYLCGKVRKLGRVDHKDAFFDSFYLERKRGITIFSKLAHIEYRDMRLTLMDTPGHKDFGAETERALSVLDMAVFIVSGADEIKPQSKVLMRLLEEYGIPVFVFVNKMDRALISKDEILKRLKGELSFRICELSENAWAEGSNENKENRENMEEIALCDEALTDEYLEKGILEKDSIRCAIDEGRIFPAVFGSALKLEGVEELLNIIAEYATVPDYDEAFGGLVYKISEDERGNRLSHIKLTGGSLKVKSLIGDEKADEIRIYDGDKFTLAEEVCAGDICAVKGLKDTYAGQGLGSAGDMPEPILRAEDRKAVILPEDIQVKPFFMKLCDIAEELPELSPTLDDVRNVIGINSMGSVQLEVLKNICAEKYNVDLIFEDHEKHYDTLLSLENAELNALLVSAEEDADNDGFDLNTDDIYLRDPLTGKRKTYDIETISDEEIEAIFNSAARNKKSDGERGRNRYKRRRVNLNVDFSGGNGNESTGRKSGKPSPLKDILLVDGYNIIFAWQELKELSEINMDSARDALIDKMCDYQGMTGVELILVYDAYKVKGNIGSENKYKNIYVVYTKEAQTADQYIERTVHELKGKARIRVATSDRLEQMIIWGDGAFRVSAREFEEEFKRTKEEYRERYGL